MATSGWAQISACIVSTESETSLGSHLQVSIFHRLRFGVCSPPATGLFGLAPTKALPVGTVASSLITQGSLGFIFSESSRIMMARYGSAGMELPLAGCV